MEPALTDFEEASRPRKVLRLETKAKRRRMDLAGPVQGEVFHLDVVDTFFIGGEPRGRENVKYTRERREDDQEEELFTGVS
jgi:hypothetical protein